MLYMLIRIKLNTGIVLYVLTDVKTAVASILEESSISITYDIKL